jgi:hypothetical protein
MLGAIACRTQAARIRCPRGRPGAPAQGQRGPPVLNNKSATAYGIGVAMRGGFQNITQIIFFDSLVPVRFL